MAIHLKPNKGWEYRVIICDKQGNYEHDDVILLDQVVEMTKVLIIAIRNKEGLGHRGV